jgi:hypothetical protein
MKLPSLTGGRAVYATRRPTARFRLVKKTKPIFDAGVIAGTIRAGEKRSQTAGEAARKLREQTQFQVKSGSRMRTADL